MRGMSGRFRGLDDHLPPLISPAVSYGGHDIGKISGASPGIIDDCAARIRFLLHNSHQGVFVTPPLFLVSCNISSNNNSTSRSLAGIRSLVISIWPF